MFSYYLVNINHDKTKDLPWFAGLKGSVADSVIAENEGFEPPVHFIERLFSRQLP